VSLFLPAAGRAAITSATVAPTGVAFGAFTQKATTGTISVIYTGTGNANVTLALSAGGSGSFGGRKMSHGTATLTYNLYQDSAHTIIWGNGAGGGQILSDRVSFMGVSPLTKNYTVFGLLPAQGQTAPGTYLDTIVVTLTF